MIETTPFTKFDWYGWAGAEPPDEATEPRIGSMRVLEVPPHPQGGPYMEDADGTNGTVILDKSGITINFWCEDGCASDLRKSCEFGAAVLWARLLEPQMTLEELQSLGFEFNEF